MPDPLTWWELDRTDYAVVRLAQPWLAHEGRLWALIEIENIGDGALGIDYMPDDDEGLWLAFLGLRGSRRERIFDEIALCKIARIRFEEGTIRVRLGPGQRWRLHSKSVELAHVQRAASATVYSQLRSIATQEKTWIFARPNILTAHLSGAITLVTEADTHVVQFDPPPGISGPVPTIDLGPRPELPSAIERHPERIHARLHDLDLGEDPRAGISYVSPAPPTFYCWGFARDDAEIPPALRAGLAGLGDALNRLPEGAITIRVCGYIELESVWFGPGWETLASARASAVIEALGLTRSQEGDEGDTSRTREPMPDPAFGDAWWRCVEISLWRRTPEWAMDLLSAYSVSPGPLLTILRQNPVVHALLDDGRVTCSHLRALYRERSQVIAWLLAPSRICASHIGPRWDTLQAFVRAHGRPAPQWTPRMDDLDKLVSSFGPTCEALVRIHGALTGINLDTLTLPSSIDDAARRCVVRLERLRAMAPDERLRTLMSMLVEIDLDDDLAPALVVAIADARLDQDQHRVFAAPAWSRFERAVADADLEDLLRNVQL